ncbi:MAG: anion permease, partial [Proteobacteria bacterium]|nr:anion permease [Pseudomonadota bacterium]
MGAGVKGDFDNSGPRGRLRRLAGCPLRTLGGPGITAALALALVLVLALPLDLQPPAHRLAAVLAFVVVFWTTEAIPLPITALLGASLCVVAGIGTAKEVFAPFAHPIIYLLLGSFLLARAMTVHGLDRRLAYRVLALPGVAERPARILGAMGGLAAVLSMWISNTAATAMMLPIARGVFATLADRGERRSFGTGLMLMIAYGATVGGIATLIGTPTNLVGAGFLADELGVTISFVRWMGLGLPVSLVMFLFLYGLIRLLHPPTVKRMEGLTDQMRKAYAALGPMVLGYLRRFVPRDEA